jgi:antitoxin component YwqK of YwqJK toxin-antitoxin module
MKLLAVLLGLTFMLSSCGGGAGGGGGSVSVVTPPPSTPVPSTPTDAQVKSFSGMVAAGAAVEGAEVSVDDLEGHVADTISDAEGGWIVPFSSIKRSVKPPFRFHAKFTRAGRVFDLFSISLEKSGDIQANITPLSDMVTRAYAWDVSPSDDTAWMKVAPSQTRLDSSVSGVKKVYGDALAASDNLISGRYDRNPNVNKQDAVLEVTEAPAFDNGTATIRDGAGHEIAKTTLAKISANSVPGTDAETVVSTEYEAAKAIRGPLPISPPVLKNNAIPIIAKVAPLTTTVGVPTTFIVTGSNLGRIFDLAMTIENCPSVQSLGGTDTAQSFVCTPNAAGVKEGMVQEAHTRTARSSFVVTISAPVDTNVPPVVDSIAPLIANLNEKTIYTITGKGFINGMRFTLEGCSGTELVEGGNTTIRKFSCTSALSGINKGEVKDKVDGTLLKTFSVLVSKVATPGTTLTCTTEDDREYNGEAYYAVYNKYCYSLDNKGARLIQGIWEQYISATKMLSIRAAYVDGVLNGPYQSFAGGRLWTEGFYTGGKRSGIWHTYYDDGTLAREDTWGIDTLITKEYCGPGSKRLGALSTVTTTNLKTQESAIQNVANCFF